MEKVNVGEKLAQFNDQWKAKIVGELNGQQVKLVKFQGPFVWHHHDQEDEFFLVVKGRFRMEFRDRQIWLEAGEFLIVPHGVEHRPVADEEAHVLCSSRPRPSTPATCGTSEPWSGWTGCDSAGSVPAIGGISQASAARPSARGTPNFREKLQRCRCSDEGDLTRPAPANTVYKTRPFGYLKIRGTTAGPKCSGTSPG